MLSLHGRLLRTMSAAAGVHFQGLSSASRKFKHILSTRQQRKLRELDACLGILRHITTVSSDAFHSEIYDTFFDAIHKHDGEKEMYDKYMYYCNTPDCPPTESNATSKTLMNFHSASIEAFSAKMTDYEIALKKDQSVKTFHSAKVETNSTKVKDSVISLRKAQSLHKSALEHVEDYGKILSPCAETFDKSSIDMNATFEHALMPMHHISHGSDWLCEHCGTPNWYDRDACRVCHT